jgi:NPCBM/NEW2 domain
MKNSMMTATPSPLVRSLRAASPLVGLTLLTLSLVACGGGSSAPSANTPELPAATEPAANNASGTDASTTAADLALVPYTYDGQDHSWNEQASGNIVTQALSNGNNDLSAQSWSSATSGWGPVELNRSNGEKGGADGRTITLDGKTYTGGLGVHSASTITYDLNGQCAGFQSDMGIDDEVRSLGSVTFEIWADGTKLYDSGVMHGYDYRKFASVNLAGKKQLKLVVTNAGDNANYDHADWAGATLLGCTISGGKTSVTPPPPVAPSTNPTYAGPLVITKGGTYSGNWEGQDANRPVISIQTSDPVIIENSNIRGRGDLIAGYYHNRVTVRNVRGYELNPNFARKSAGNSVVLADPYNVSIENNYFEGTNGIYILRFAGNSNAGETIKILRNKMKNINGRPSDGNNGWIATEGYDKHPHAIQFNQIQKVPNVDIAWNEVINEPFKSLVEENFNFYISSGTSNSPILVHDNYIQGGYNALPDTNPNYSGGGIAVGDGLSDNPDKSGNINVYNNQIVGTTNEGMALAGGFSNKIYSNRVISSGLLPDGRKILAANIGIYVWDHLGANKKFPGVFGNNVMSNNYAAWTKHSSNGSSFSNGFWTPDCGVNNTSCTGNVVGPIATLDTEKQEYQAWLKKVASNSQVVGPTN